MNKTDIQRLQAHSGYPQVTILLTTHPTAPDNKADPVALKNALAQAEKRLAKEFSARERRPIMERLQGMAEAVDHRHNTRGLALFAGAEHGEWHRLPFSVQARIVIDETYATRDLVYAFNRTPRYRVLVITDAVSRLYEGLGEHLTELTTGGFPRSRTGPGADQPLPGGRGIEPSTVDHQRASAYLEEVTRALQRIHDTDPLPLVVTAGDRDAGDFRRAFGDSAMLAGHLPGSHGDTPATKLAALVRPVLHDWLAKRQEADLERLDAATGAQRAAAGLQECWRVASEGRVNRLLVEEDYRVAGRVNDAGTLVPVEDPEAPGIIDDAVDELIETVLAHGGRVTFLEPGRLEERRRIAAILRH